MTLEGEISPKDLAEITAGVARLNELMNQGAAYRVRLDQIEARRQQLEKTLEILEEVDSRISSPQISPQ